MTVGDVVKYSHGAKGSAEVDLGTDKIGGVDTGGDGASPPGDKG